MALGPAPDSPASVPRTWPHRPDLPGPGPHSPPLPAPPPPPRPLPAPRPPGRPGVARPRRRTCLDLAWAAVGPFLRRIVTVSQSLSAMAASASGGPPGSSAAAAGDPATRRPLVARPLPAPATAPPLPPIGRQSGGGHFLLLCTNPRPAGLRKPRGRARREGGGRLGRAGAEEAAAGGTSGTPAAGAARSEKGLGTGGGVGAGGVTRVGVPCAKGRSGDRRTGTGRRSEGHCAARRRRGPLGGKGEAAGRRGEGQGGCAGAPSPASLPCRAASGLPQLPRGRTRGTGRAVSPATWGGRGCECPKQVQPQRFCAVERGLCFIPLFCHDACNPPSFIFLELYSSDVGSRGQEHVQFGGGLLRKEM